MSEISSVQFADHETEDESGLSIKTDVSIAIAEKSGPNPGVVGVACLDVRHSTLYLYYFQDDNRYNRLNTVLKTRNPKAILIPNTPGEERKSYTVLSGLTDNSLPAEVIPFDRNAFNDDQGWKLLQDFVLDPQVTAFDVKGKTECLSASSALLQFFMSTEDFVLAPNSLKVVMGSQDTLFLDPITIESLELLNSEEGKWQESLFGFLNNCKTRPGMRFLRSSIIEPSMDVKVIEKRQEAIQELIDDQRMADVVAEVLKNLQVDLNFASFKLVMNPRSSSVKFLETQIDSIVFVRHVINGLSPLLEVLSDCKSQLLRDLLEVFQRQGLYDILSEIQKNISDECVLHKGSLNFKNSKIFAVREDADEHLKLRRQVYSDLMSDLQSLQYHLNEMLGLVPGTIKVIQAANRGYHLEVPVEVFKETGLPKIFQRESLVSSGKRYWKCSCLDLEKLNQRIDQVMADIIRCSHTVLSQLIAFLRQPKNLILLHDLTDALSQLDFLSSLAVTAADFDLSRPSFGEKMWIKNALNPIFLKKMRATGNNPVANDISLFKGNTTMIITGANMSGKSCFIRQIALLQILAQMGSLIPADRGSIFRMTDQIFTRIGSDDDVETNCSTFMNEIRQLRYLLEKMTSNSLVIIDELGRGTSDEEGVGLCVSVLESLVQTGCFTLFATHFHDLIAIHELYPKISVFMMETKVNRRGQEVTLEFTHKLHERKEGDVEGNYGIDLAQMSGLKSSIIEEARSVLQQTSLVRHEVKVNVTGLAEKARVSRHLVKLAKMAADDVRLTQKSDFFDYLEGLKQRFLENMKFN